MKYCSNCGAELQPNAIACMNCGVKAPNVQENSNDTGSIGYSVLGFFIPIAGLILWLMWKNTKPKNSNAAKKGFLLYVIVYAALMFLSFVLSVFSTMI